MEWKGVGLEEDEVSLIFFLYCIIDVMGVWSFFFDFE